MWNVGKLSNTCTPFSTTNKQILHLFIQQYSLLIFKEKWICFVRKQNMQNRTKQRCCIIKSEYWNSYNNFKRIREKTWICRNKGMSLHIVAPFSFSLISSLPRGSTHFLQCHFEWQRTPKFLLATAYNPLSLHLSLKAQCPVPMLLLCSSEEKVKDFTGS